ncbi:MAG: ATP-binding protein [Bacillota bacterium]|nr:ATP-binding protein [Bacillota bacterium]
MKEVLVLSGKGGTGKTSISSSFIYFAEHCVACDYDVDASNLHILLNPDGIEAHPFSSSDVAVIDPEGCTQCGLCEEICRFDAIEDFQVSPLACEGCAFCFHVCPVDAIKMQSRSSGRWFASLSEQQKPFYYAELRPGEENSGKLVAQVKNAAREKAVEQEIPLIIADGPPGIGCAVISSMVSVNLAIIVAEPSLSGFHDMKRVYELLAAEQLKAVLIINKCDLNLDVTKEMEEWAVQHNVPCAGRIPYNKVLADAITRAEIPASVDEVRSMLFPIWENVLEYINQP